jgi:iron complex transport system ATP-binding protein
MSNPALRCENLRYVVRGKVLIADASLSLAEGEVTVIVGPNGAGKSTLLRLLTGEIKPAQGRVLIGDEALASIPPWRLAAKRAVMMQAARLAFPFTVREVVALGVAGIGRAMTASARENVVHEALVASDVAHLTARAYQTLSGGEQQRVQFARALAQLQAGRSLEQRQLLFLDEPVSSLDLRHQLALLDAATEIARSGVAVLAVLHDLNLALSYADRLIVVHDGRVAANGAADVVLTDTLLQSVFGVTLPLKATPPGGAPFLLPQMHRVQATA